MTTPIPFRSTARRLVVRRRRGIHVHHVVTSQRPSEQVLGRIGSVHDLHR